MSWRGTHRLPGVPSLPASWGLLSFSILWEARAHLPNPCRYILPELSYLSPLSRISSQPGDHAGPRTLLLWRLGIGDQGFQQSKTEERWNLGRGLVVVAIFCPWSGEQRQPVCRQGQEWRLSLSGFLNGAWDPGSS